MASTNLLQIYRICPALELKFQSALTLHRHSKNDRNSIMEYSSLVPTPPPCPKRAPCKKEKKKRPSLFSRLLGQKKKEPKPALETCRLRQKECPPSPPDLSFFGGKAFKTCGPAYIIQKDVLPSEPCTVSHEDKALKTMEANFGKKANANDPMPAFTTVEQRMLDLNQRRLHPLYRVYRNVPKKKKLGLPQRETYKMRSGPINPNEIPKQFRFNNKLLEKKNMFADYKRVEPPQQLVAKISEIRRNEKPPLVKKMPVIPQDAQRESQSSVFDTLYQKETKF